MSVSLIYKCSVEDFQKIIAKSNSYREALQKIGYKSFSGTTLTLLKKRIKEENLSIEHFWKDKKHQRKITKEEVFQENSTVSQRCLRERYSKENAPLSCEICGQKNIWQGKPLTLILDHKNGNCHDNRLSNLRWVCPNCNQQLETTGFKKFRIENDFYGTRSTKTKKEFKKSVCPQCGEEKSPQAKVCSVCAAKQKIIPIKQMSVTREELKYLIRTTPFTTIGEKFNVSDNTIRKWCDKLNLPRKVSEIKKYSDEEWEKI